MKQQEYTVGVIYKAASFLMPAHVKNPLTIFITLGTMRSLSLSLLLQNNKAVTGAQWAPNTPQIFWGACVELTLHRKLSWYKTLPGALSKGEDFLLKSQRT